MFEIMEKEKCQQSRSSSLSIHISRSHSASYMFNQSDLIFCLGFFFSQMYVVLDAVSSNLKHKDAAKDIKSFAILHR